MNDCCAAILGTFHKFIAQVIWWIALKKMTVRSKAKPCEELIWTSLQMKLALASPLGPVALKQAGQHTESTIMWTGLTASTSSSCWM